MTINNVNGERSQTIDRNDDIVNVVEEEIQYNIRPVINVKPMKAAGK